MTSTSQPAWFQTTVEYTLAKYEDIALKPFAFQGKNLKAKIQQNLIKS